MTSGSKYFGCGWKKKIYYNYAVELILIGHFYGDKECLNNDYHKEVKYIANAVGGISKENQRITAEKMKT